MKTKEALKKSIENFLKREQLLKNEEYKNLEKPFLKKARRNFSVANLLFKISEQEDFRKLLNLSSDFESYDWVIVVSYYSMYTSALAALAKLSLKSKSHTATITALNYNYTKETKKDDNKSKSLEQKDISKLEKAYALSEHLIAKLMQNKTSRETAQYDATPGITKENAKASLADAEEFITKIEEILSPSPTS